MPCLRIIRFIASKPPVAHCEPSQKYLDAMPDVLAIGFGQIGQKHWKVRHCCRPPVEF
jgi:hypothetical protein